MTKQIIFSLLGLTLVGCGSDFYYNNGQKVELTKIKSTQQEKKQTNQAITYYKTSTGHQVGIKDEILVECQKEVDCKKLLNTYTLKSISQLSDKIFLVTAPQGEDILKLSQKLFEDKNIANAHPNFIKKHKRR